MLRRSLNWLTEKNIRLYFFATLVTAVGMWLAYRTIEPAPEMSLVMSAGRGDGAYYLYAQRYAEILAAEGVHLEVLHSGGSLENLQRLRNPDTDVDLAFIQGGVTDPGDGAELMSLASLFYEPVWFFYRADAAGEISSVFKLQGRVLAIGNEGSGTAAVIGKIMQKSGFPMTEQTILKLGGMEAAQALMEGRVDGAFFIASPASPTLQRLFHQSGVRLMHFDRAEAYAMRYPFLSSVKVPRGAMDLQLDIPPRDVTMVATTANLVARRTLHPALVDLLLKAATRVHSRGGLFEHRGQFPSPDHVELPLSPDAERFLSNGPGLLDRFLPFWAATLIDRFKVMLVPVLVLFVPLFKYLPKFIVWRMRSRIYRWYGELAKVEQQVKSEDTHEFEAAIARLGEINELLQEVRVPGSFSRDLYILREHVDMLRTQIERANAR